MQVDYPYHFDARGRTAQVDDDAHVRDLIEQVLFTAPGERVNRPTFGSGMLQLIFGANGPEVATATQFLVQGALQQWLGDLVQIHSVDGVSVDSQLVVTVVYQRRGANASRTASFTRPIS